MRLFCNVDNLGYGDLVDLDLLPNDDFLIHLKFDNGIIKKYSLSRSLNKVIFSSSEKTIADYSSIVNAIMDAIRNKSINEQLNDKLRKQILIRGEELRKLLSEKYGFEGFVHETTIKNFCSIFNEGYLKPRVDIKEFEDSANHAVLDKTQDEIKNKVRFYFYKKTPTNYKFDNLNPNNMVYLIFDWKLFYEANSLLSNGNAGSDYTDFNYVVNYLIYQNDFMDWNSIFDRNPLPPDDFCSIEMYHSKNEIIRKRNAELLIPKNVPISYLSKIVFKTKEAYDEFVKNTNNDIMLSEYKDKIIIDSSYFYF